MIKIESSGRLGNKLHYFVFAKYVSQITNQTLIPERIEGFTQTYFNHVGTDDKNYNYIKTSQFDINKPNIFEELKNHKGGIIVDNMLGMYKIFQNLSPFVKSYLEIDEKYDKNFNLDKNDLVIHIRLGDYKQLDWVTDKSLYLKVLDIEYYNKCYIVTDYPNDSFLDEFKNRGCIIISNNILDDFLFIKSANKICISKSTFSWISAYISDAEKIYFPLSDNKYPYLYNPTNQDADLRPFDKKNWIII